MTDTDITRWAPTIVVTGPNRGLGLETCRALAGRSPDSHLVLLGRAGQRTDAVVTELRGRVRSVTFVAVDFSDLDQIRASGREVDRMVATGACGPIDGLVLNAGIQTVDRLHRTADGLELTFGVNVVAPFLLVRSLAASATAGAATCTTRA